MYLSVVWGVLSFFSLAFLVSQMGQYYIYLLQRRREYKQAMTFMASENCQNPLMRSHLGSFNLCDKSEEVLGRYPFVSAIHDVATDLHICGHGRCGSAYVDITQNLHKIVIGTALLSILGVWVFRKTCAESRERREIEYYTLPTRKKIN